MKNRLWGPVDPPSRIRVNREKLDLAYKMYIRPHLEYGDVIFHGSAQYLINSIESVQYQAGLIVTGWKKQAAINFIRSLAGSLYPKGASFADCAFIIR